MKAFLPLFIIIATLGSVSQAQIPKLNSLPTATAVLYLDFDGQTVSGTQWNTTYTSGSPIVAVAPTLTAAQITEIHNRISEDYRPFEINVTTDSTVYKAAPANKRCYLVFTTSNSWYPNSAGGVAYIGVFSSSSSTRKVGWVFPNKLNNSPATIAIAGAHEAGHQFGLQHQSNYDNACTLVSEYHQGLGTGQEAWGPIMGAPYGKNNVIWHTGPIKTNCSTIQNDLSVLTSTNNLRYRADDHGNTSTTATVLATNSASFSSSGIITTPTDVDVFSIQVAKTSLVSITASPYNVGTSNKGADLNIKLTLRNANTTILFQDTSRTLMDANFKNIVLQPGTYYIEIDGDKSIYASDYGSLGSYSLTGSVASQTTTGLEKIALETSVQVFPNPAKSTVTIDLGVNYMDVESLALIDLNGAKIMSNENPIAEQIQLDLHQVPKGMYLIRIMTSGIVLHKSLIME